MNLTQCVFLCPVYYVFLPQTFERLFYGPLSVDAL